MFCAVALFGQKDSAVVNKIPDLIPQKLNGKVGYVNHDREYVIAPQFHLAMFFNPDCNLLNSKNVKVRKFGTGNFATVEENEISYRINKKGRQSL